MNSGKKFNFTDLDREVIQEGLCGRCGGCVSFCTADRIGALEVGGDGFTKYSDQEKCLECGLCYFVCPQTKVLDNEMKEKFGWRAASGHYENLFSVRATDKEVLNAATDGGFVTSLLLNMLENNKIDGAVVSQKIGTFARKPVVATTRESLIDAAGSQFSESPQLEEMGVAYSSCVPVVQAIQDFKSRPLHKIAVVGTPCQINAVRKMQVLGIVPSDHIVFTVGLFCMQCFDLDDLMKKKFAQKHNINLDDIVKMNIKEDFILQMKSGITVHFPLEEIEMIARKACLACQYFANEFADVSVGGLGSPEGYTTLMVRSILGKQMVSDAFSSRAIEHKPTANKQESEYEKQKMASVVAAFSEKKKQRGKSYWQEFTQI
jgi:coenzyme F420 hydrogenase subunit beta